jgi:aspartate-semialdehyde dehydrogenase
MTSSEAKHGARIAIVGATGAVGRALFATLARRNFPISQLRAMASRRSAGQRLDTPLGPVTVEPLEDASFDGVDFAFFSAGGSVSLQHAPRAAAEGATVIDNTSAFRMDPLIPLVVPEVNAAALGAMKPGIIANPNCSTAQLVLALAPLHAAAGLARVTVTTFQSASGAGQKGIDELLLHTRAHLASAPLPAPSVHARSLAFNCIPQIGSFDADGYTTEEWKMTLESRKILNIPDLALAATCVRVPVLRGHSEVIHVQTHQHLPLDRARALLSSSPGLTLIDDPAQGLYPTPIDCEDRFDSLLGRLRADLSHPNGLTFWLISDNLLKGAALNAIQIAEHLWR